MAPRSWPGRLRSPAEPGDRGHSRCCYCFCGFSESSSHCHPGCSRGSSGCYLRSLPLWRPQPRTGGARGPRCWCREPGGPPAARRRRARGGGRGAGPPCASRCGRRAAGLKTQGGGPTARRARPRLPPASAWSPPSSGSAAAGAGWGRASGEELPAPAAAGNPQPAPLAASAGAQRRLLAARGIAWRVPERSAFPCTCCPS